MKNSIFSPECRLYGEEIDRLIIEKNYVSLITYLSKLEEFSSTHHSPEFAPIFYYMGNATSALASYYKKTGTDEESTKYRKKSLYYQRKALSLVEHIDNNDPLSLFIYTNYANDLDACGRVIEALRIYRKVLDKEPMFGMAIGNYGRALNFYGNLVNDSGHHELLHSYAYQALKQSLEIRDPNMHEEAVEYFQNMINEYESSPFKELINTPIEFDEYDLGESEEFKYRIWCLNNHLFLNPLNDLITSNNSFAHDPLTITHYTELIDHNKIQSRITGNPPKWFSMLNQLKEEFIYSRFLCYEGSQKQQELHFADKNVKLSLSSFDYVNYSIRLEQLKSAFKNLFSIFDQVAFVINEFWNLGINERTADAAHVFKSPTYPTHNTALTALYWSSCEFNEKFGNAEEAHEKNLKILRNALEHKFVKIHEFETEEKLEIKDDRFYHISQKELIEYTLRLLELAREWIMYLVYAIGIEESKKDTKNKAIHLNVVDFEDEWKI